MKKSLPIICLIFLLYPIICFGQLSEKESLVINKFGDQLKKDVEIDNIKGSISATVIKNNKIIWSNAYGYANRDKKILADTNTIYRIGSITKTFTATLLMLLVEDKKINLDDLAEKYVPEVKDLQGYSNKTKFTIRQLASHTSGLKREPDMARSNVGSIEQWERKLLSCLPNTSFNSNPGEQYLYSNIGYAILGLALERAANVPYIQMVQQRILTPLHMNQTFFALTKDRKPHLAEGLDNTKGPVNTDLPLQEHEGRGYRVPNGSLYSTPNDLAKFVMSFMGVSPLLKKSSIQEMQTVPVGGKNYGLGLSIVPSRIVNVIGHNGSVPGYTSQFFIEKDSQYAVILIRNSNAGNTDLGKDSLMLLKELK
ncbi:MAG TPA: serine hydrolase domain-containing protein [Mucilaginibacter sp.]|jgi:CubicO group peptidase (beta-lactamase class C family)|nr:serine hydrolase domain-containing protein [Mucilaginibacter sp.]